LILAWRLCQASQQAFAFDGEAARRYGGRWNPKGRSAVYAAATQSLATLEILVKADTDLLAKDYLVFGVGIPEHLAIERILPQELPPRWHEAYPPLACQTLGGAWLERGRSAVLAVPSAVFPAETLYILNPLHPDFAKLLVCQPSLFRFDQRRWHSNQGPHDRPVGTEGSKAAPHSQEIM